MKFLVTRKKVVRESVILDVPVPAFMQAKEAAEFAAKYFARQWDGTWKSESVEEITVDARPVDATEPAANDEPVMTLTEVIDALKGDELPDQPRATSKWDSMVEHGLLTGFVMQRTGWLERKLMS